MHAERARHMGEEAIEQDARATAFAAAVARLKARAADRRASGHEPG